MSVHTDCVEDVDTLLADICFNEDLYAKPPTVEFTVIDHTVASSHNSQNAQKVPRRVSTSNIPSNNLNSLNNDHIGNGNTNMNSSMNTNMNINMNTSNSMSMSNSNSNMNMSNNNTTTPNNRLKNINIRAPNTEPLKALYSSGKEVPFDHDDTKEMTVYIGGRNRVVYYGVNGSPYYITDSGKKYFYHALLYCIILYCVSLCLIVFCFVLLCIIVFCCISILSYLILYCFLLFVIDLYHLILFDVVLCNAILFFIIFII